MNASIVAFGDWLIVPILVVATCAAALMLAWPDDLSAVVAGVAAGHVTATDQVQASLCYRLRAGQPAAQKRGLRLQAFSSTFGYSSGALLGGALYEYAGFRTCTILQQVLIGTMAAVSAMLPVVRTSFREHCCSALRRDANGAGDDAAVGAAGNDAAGCAPSAPNAASEPQQRLTVRGTTDWLLRPVSMIWLSDGMNIACYITEWSLFAVYFADAYRWSSTLTGAAQMAGDLLAAAILALTTTPVWARLLRHRGATHHFDRLVLQPPWNLIVFFLAFSVTFAMLAQPIFVVSVVGQVAMGTVYVFNRQAVAEAYIVLSHGDLVLFRKLDFVGHFAFNLSMGSACARRLPSLGNASDCSLRSPN